MFVILFVAHAKKFASATTADTWCVQMTSASKLAAATFFRMMGQSNWHVAKKIESKKLGGTSSN